MIFICDGGISPIRHHETQTDYESLTPRSEAEGPLVLLTATMMATTAVISALTQPVNSHVLSQIRPELGIRYT
jgi:hypothetical protein